MATSLTLLLLTTNAHSPKKQAQSTIPRHHKSLMPMHRALDRVPLFNTFPGSNLWPMKAFSNVDLAFVVHRKAHMAYLAVHSRADESWRARSVRYSCAISGTRGSSGLASVSREHTESKTFESVSAGLHWSFKMSKQIPPFELILQWYIFVVKFTCTNVWNKYESYFRALKTFYEASPRKIIS